MQDLTIDTQFTGGADSSDSEVPTPTQDVSEQQFRRGCKGLLQKSKNAFEASSSSGDAEQLQDGYTNCLKYWEELTETAESHYPETSDEKTQREAREGAGKEQLPHARQFMWPPELEGGQYVRTSRAYVILLAVERQMSPEGETDKQRLGNLIKHLQMWEENLKDDGIEPNFKDDQLETVANALLVVLPDMPFLQECDWREISEVLKGKKQQGV